MTLAASSTAQNFWRYVQEQGYSGSINDQLSKLLTAEGYSGPTPSSLYSLLGSLGYAGTLNERINSFEREYTIRYGNTAAWSPLSLFSAGEQGVWFDPSDFSTMFQDSAGTTPVTAVGDPVGKILDKSGNGKHASQSTAASRPVLRNDGTNYYLEFDGTDDFLVTSAIDFSATDKIALFFGFRKGGDIKYRMSLELSANAGSNNGTFNVLSTGGDASSPANSICITAKGTSSGAYDATTYAANSLLVLSANLNIGGATIAEEIIPRVNGATPTLAVAGTASSSGTGNFAASQPLYIGRRGGSTLAFDGRIYSLIITGRTATAAEITAAESYAAGKCGVTL